MKMTSVIQSDVVNSSNNNSKCVDNSNDKQADIEIVEGELKQEKQQNIFKDLISKINPSSYRERPNYSRIDFSANKWLMSYDENSLSKLENPPSLADGISLELEKDIRYLGCELIQSGAILLKLSQTAAATAQILFQRFYYQKSFVQYSFEHMLCACLFLASKIEEQPRMPGDVINVYHRLKQLYQHRQKISNGGDIRSVNLQHLRPKECTNRHLPQLYIQLFSIIN
ncbi:unnamed protein product [Meloidogyne enterolobii]|uniref:Uncharacterized protein n=1 Tax=Meloidogyne enterolobii TaxID=390850 RepID=A0ACB0XWB4_MELEN